VLSNSGGAHFRRQSPQRKAKSLGIILAAALAVVNSGRAATFGGHDCVDNCEGHAAGYDWAELHQIEHWEDCSPSDSLSFQQGCQTRVDNPGRGSDQDDDGNEIRKDYFPSPLGWGRPVPPPSWLQSQPK
jgi:hypothetical protein